MYLSICINNYSHYKKGEIFDTYQRLGNGAFLKKMGVDQKFENISMDEYSHCFREFSDFLFLPTTKKIIKKKLFNKSETFFYKR